MSPMPRHTLQKQESTILDAAAKCIGESSLLAFTMAALSEESGLSMGSVYKHVQSKEDVLVALASRSMEHLRVMTKEVFDLPLTTPERLVCNVLLNPERFHLYPFGVHLEMLIGNYAVVQKASARWVEKLARLDESMEIIVVDALLDACSQGELEVRESEQAQTVEELMVGLWSMHVGFVQVAYQRHTRQLSETEHKNLPFPLPTDHNLIQSSKRLLNTYPWREPLRVAGIEKASALLIERGLR